MSEPELQLQASPVPVKTELHTLDDSMEETSTSKTPLPSKVVVLADLNANPPETDAADSCHLSAPDLTRSSFLLALASLLLIFQFFEIFFYQFFTYFISISFIFHI